MGRAGGTAASARRSGPMRRRSASAWETLPRSRSAGRRRTPFAGSAGGVRRKRSMPGTAPHRCSAWRRRSRRSTPGLGRPRRPRARRSRGSRRRHGRGRACALRLAALPRRRALPPERDRAPGTARARTAGQAPRARRPHSRADAGHEAPPRRERRDQKRSSQRRVSRARRQLEDVRISRLPPLARGRLEPHRAHGACPRSARRDRLDRRRGRRRQPDSRPLHAHDERRPNRLRVGRRRDGLRRAGLPATRNRRTGHCTRT